MSSLTHTAYADALVTFVFSFLSLIGSILVLLSYMVARSKSTPRIANLILHLAASDFFWFLSAGIQATYWLFTASSKVPSVECFILSPLMIFTRMASLAWTCVISFNVLMSVEKRKWLWQGGDESWKEYHKRYYIAIFLLAAPGTVLTLIKQHSNEDTSNLGCSPDYEALGVWYEVFFPEVLPIFLGFLVNVYVFLRVYGKISKSAYPQSVRKRRKRIMYHYIIVCIICWVPTVATYMIELIGFHSPEVEIIARACLYSSGFLNFLVFGMQDPHLKRSFKLMMYYSGATTLCMIVMPSSSYYYHFGGWAPLKATDVEKNVMFVEETILDNADVSKDKRSVYRNRKLSKADRLDLYAERPDLDLRTPVDASGSPVKSAMKGSRASSSNNNSNTTTTSTAGAESNSASFSPPTASDFTSASTSESDVGSLPNDAGKRDKSRSSRDADRRARAKSPSTSASAVPISREEKAASLFHSHVKSGSLTVHSVVPAHNPHTQEEDEEAPGSRVRSGSRSRSSSFHSGVSDGKYDLLAPLLGAQQQQQQEKRAGGGGEFGGPGGAASYPQSQRASLLDSEERFSDSQALSKKNSYAYSMSSSSSNKSQHLLGTPQDNPLLRGASPQPMGVVSAGYRSSSTERVVGQSNDSDLEAGGRPERKDNAEEMEWDPRQQRISNDHYLRDADELSSSDDESDDEDKELSIPISAL